MSRDWYGGPHSFARTVDEVKAFVERGFLEQSISCFFLPDVGDPADSVSPKEGRIENSDLIFFKLLC